MSSLQFPNSVANNMLGNAGEDVHIVPNAVSASFFEYAESKQQARRTLGLQEKGPIIGVPGTLRPMKGHPFFFEAIVPIVKGHPDLLVAVTGGGESGYVEELKGIVDSLGIRPNVHFLGYLEDMPAFYRGCDVVCIPSRAEPFGRTVIEAFATSVPVIATAVGGIVEIIEHEENGILVNYGDRTALASALLGILQDKDLSSRLSNNALQTAMSHYHESLYKTRISQIVSDISQVGNVYEPAFKCLRCSRGNFNYQ